MKTIEACRDTFDEEKCTRSCPASDARDKRTMALARGALDGLALLLKVANVWSARSSTPNRQCVTLQGGPWAEVQCRRWPWSILNF
jgi:hypothetical protein